VKIIWLKKKVFTTLKNYLTKTSSFVEKILNFLFSIQTFV